ncbi:MAG: type II secretion system protein [Clostridia bacterium]
MKNHKGFTLLELLGVLFILALLINPAIPLVNKTIYNAKEAVCNNNRETILRAYKRYNYFQKDMSLADIINEDNWPKGFEMDKDHRYCPLGGEYFAEDSGQILCSIHDSKNYPSEETFYEFIEEEDVFLYSSAITCSNLDNLSGEGATIYITDDLMRSDVNGESNISVSNIYVDGDMIMETGSPSFGSQSSPGTFIIDGDLTVFGVTGIYSNEIYVTNDLQLKDAIVDATIYVRNDVVLGWGESSLSNDTKIYYGGNITHPPTYSESILDKIIHIDTTADFDSIPTKEIPSFSMPNTKADQWYLDREYVSSGNLESSIRVYADEYIIESTHGTIDDPISDVVVIAKSGNIEITGQSDKAVKGFLFAPKGKVIIGGISSFEGIVIARDGFEVIGNSLISFITVEEIFPNEEDIPFE